MKLRGLVEVSAEEQLARIVHLAQDAGSWSKDPKCRVGAVVFDPNFRMWSSGCNAFPHGIKDTAERLHDQDLKRKLTVHAELNAILNAGFDVAGCHLLVLRHPCHECAKDILQARITKVYCPVPELDHRHWGWSHELAVSLFAEAGLEVQWLTLPITLGRDGA